MKEFSNVTLVTGGAGFIGSNFLRQWIEENDTPVVTLDKLTYAGSCHNLESVLDDPRHTFVQGDIADRDLIRRLLQKFTPSAVINFAAESHVDRSIHGPAEFIRTNILGVFHLLEEVRSYWKTLDSSRRNAFRFLHVSTDEVYGSLGPADPAFSETTAYAPNSPYSASKAAADHLVRAYHHTYGIPTLTTNCSNNYGPNQYPEKLIPVVILNAVAGETIPVYGDGRNVRDWIYVTDHCHALQAVLKRGETGQTFNIGGSSELTNTDVVNMICAILDDEAPRIDGHSYRRQITYITDRPGHDRRYAINADKMRTVLQWEPKETFESGLRKTVRWYLDNMAWVKKVTAKAHPETVSQHYALP